MCYHVNQLPYLLLQEEFQPIAVATVSSALKPRTCHPKPQGIHSIRSHRLTWFRVHTAHC